MQFMTSLSAFVSSQLLFELKLFVETKHVLFAEGLISYIRTDSTSLGIDAVHDIREAITQCFGANFLADEPRYYAE